MNVVVPILIIDVQIYLIFQIKTIVHSLRFIYT